jgi:hypothetical protein
MEQIITCPHCKKEIPLDEALSQSIKEKAKKEFESEFHEREIELIKQQRNFEEKEKQLSEEKLKIDTEVARKLQEEKIKLEKIARKEAENKISIELQDLKNQIKEKEENLQKLEKTELILRKEKRELEERQKNLDLEVSRKLDQERKRIEENIINIKEEEYKLKVLEKEKQIESFKKQIEELNRRAEVGSQERQGEIFEIALEDALKSKFTDDIIEPVKKGKQGADIIHKIYDSSKKYCGTIIWEAKNTKAWQEVWIDKLKSDQREEKAEIAVLLTTAFPKGKKGFCNINGVWVTNYELLEEIAIVLRHSIIEIARANNASVGKTEKIEALYNYLTGTTFRQKIETIVESFLNMKKDLDKEKSVMTSHWSKREKQLERVLMATTGMYGEMQGIIGKSLPELEKLKIEALEEGKQE